MNSIEDFMDDAADPKMAIAHALYLLNEIARSLQIIVRLMAVPR